MTTSMPKDLQELFIEMSVIASIKEGEKIDFENCSKHTDSLWDRFKRTLSSEDRHKTCEKILTVVEKVSSALKEKKDSPFYNKLVQKAEEMEAGIIRIRNSTYSPDILVKAKLDNCIAVIDVSLRENERRGPIHPSAPYDISTVVYPSEMEYK